MAVRRFRTLALSVAVVAALWSRPAGAAHVPCPVEPGSYNADTDYSSHWNTSSVAREGFSVTVDNAHVMLNDTISGAQFCLYLCNTPRPEVPGNPTYFEVPVDAVAVADPALASLLSRLHVEDTLVTIGDEASVVDACLQSRMDSGWINGTANYDVVFALSGSNVTGFNESRLVTLPILDVDDPVERVEWIRFLAPFFLANPRPEMNFVEDNFNCSANQMMNARPKPKVAWLAKQDEDTFVAGDAWVEWMVTDAGFVPYPDYKTTYNQTYLLKALKTADIVIDATGGLESFGDFLETYGITDGGMDSEYPFIKYKMVFRTDRIVNDLGNSEWDVEAWTRPEEALMDLIDTAFETYKPGYNKRWMRNIAKSDSQVVASGRDCVDTTKPVTRQDVTCPSNPFNGKAPVPAWNPNAATEGSGTGDNSGTGGSGTGSQPDTDGAPGEIGTQPPMSSGKIAGIVIGSVAGAVVAAGIVLLALGLKGKNVLPRLSPRKRQMEPETPGSALGEGGRYHEMRDGEVVVPAGAAPDNYSQLELYSLEAAEDH